MIGLDAVEVIVSYFYVNGEPADLGNVWVHLQVPKSHQQKQYQLLVPLEIAAQIVGRQAIPADKELIADDVSREIDQLGTFIVDEYFGRVAKLSQSKPKPFDWVVATVDQVYSESQSIILTGILVPFICPQRTRDVNPAN